MDSLDKATETQLKNIQTKTGKSLDELSAIVRASGLDWVIFRPGFMVEEPARHDLQFAVNRDSPKQRTLSYEDFAAFVLDQVSGNGTWAPPSGCTATRCCPSPAGRTATSTSS